MRAGRRTDERTRSQNLKGAIRVSFMGIKTIPLRRLERDLQKTLNECADSGDTLVVEMPDQRLLAIQSLDSPRDDSLIDELLASNPEFRALVARSKASPRKPFAVGG